MLRAQRTDHREKPMRVREEEGMVGARGRSALVLAVFPG